MYRSYQYTGLGQSLFLHLAFVNLGMVPHPSHVFALSIFNAFLFLIPKKIKKYCISIFKGIFYGEERPWRTKYT